MIPCFQLDQADVSILAFIRFRVATEFMSQDVVKHLLLSLELVKKLMKEASVELSDNLIMIVRELKVERGIIGKLARFFVDLFYGVELVVRLEEAISPGAHDCSSVISIGASRR